MKPIILAILLVTMLICDCRRSVDLSPAERATIKSDVQLALTMMSDSVRTNGLTGWIPFLHNSTDFKWEYRGITSSYDTLVAGVRREALRYRSVLVKWDSVQVEALSGNEAMLSAKYTEVILDTNGVQSTFTGMLNGQLERVAGTWKFRNGQTPANNVVYNR
jgi:hypothetical protein